MSRSYALDSNLPSLSRPTAWELTNNRRRPYSATDLTPRDTGVEDYRYRMYSQPHEYARHRVGMSGREEMLYPQSDYRHQMVELEDMLQRYREELDLKDQEIRRLASIETPRSKGPVDPKYGVDYMGPAVSTSAELAALQIRVTTLESKLFEAERELESREQRIRDLQTSIDVRMETEARNESVLQSLHQKIADYEAAYGSIEGAANRSELAIATLQQQNNDAQQRVLDLESRLRAQADDRDKAEQRALSAELQLSEMLTQINSILLVDNVSAQTHDRTINAVRDLVHENSMLRGKSSTLSEQTKNFDVELQTNRDTIARLNAQIDRLNKASSTAAIDLENLRLERDTSLMKQREAEREIELLKDRLEASQLGWSDARRKIEEKVCEYCDNRGSIGNAVLESLAQQLSDGRTFIEPTEESIRQRVVDLLHAVRDKNARIDMLEQKVADLERDAYRSTDDRHHKRIRPEIGQLEERLRRAELELASYDSIKDSLRAEKAKFTRFLDDVVRLLRIESAILDISTDGAVDAILRRLEQLASRNETTSRTGADHSDCHLHIHGLQRKVKTLKEQLNNKESENSVLRTKVSNLEDRLTATERNDREREEEFAKNRRLVKLVEKYKLELNEAHDEIRDLKIRLSQCAELQVSTTEKERHIEKLERQVGQLEHMHERQAMKITDLEDEANSRARQMDRQDEAVATRLAILTDEVRTLRQALEESSRRERQLQDLRRVVARMLAIDIVHVPVPDYEIISRLEKLILAQQASTTTVGGPSLSLDDIIDEMGDEFRTGYQKAGFVLAPRRIRTHSPLRSCVRSRSKSPVRKLDSKVY